MLGPTRASPAKKAAIGSAVETAAMQASHSQPSRLEAEVEPAGAAPTTAKVTVAPTHTSVDSANGGAATPVASATRM